MADRRQCLFGKNLYDIIAVNMKNFSMAEQIQSWIKNKELVQIHHSERSQDYDVTYILHFEDGYLTFINLGTTGVYRGIIVCHIDDVNLFKDRAIYLSEFAKKITDDKIYQQALSDLTDVKVFTPRGFFTALKGKKNIIGLEYDSGEDFGGRVIDLDDETLVLDEYACDIDKCFSRTYLKIDRVARVYLSADWLNTITRALDDKNL